MADVIPLVLLALFAAGLAIGIGIVFFVRRLMRTRVAVEIDAPPSSFSLLPASAALMHRPECWLAIKCANTRAVQSALGLDHPTPCSWSDGLAGEKRLFIGPPVRGWILVTGSGLPTPGEDIDACFRLVVGLSRKLGQVQYFNANRVVNYHAWVRAENGRVHRAYAWAGETVWLQGDVTVAECDLGVDCRDYGDLDDVGFGDRNTMALNVEKVPLLASRWSLDPATVASQFREHEHGIAGDPSCRY